MMQLFHILLIRQAAVSVLQGSTRMASTLSVRTISAVVESSLSRFFSVYSAFLQRASLVSSVDYCLRREHSETVLPSEAARVVVPVGPTHDDAKTVKAAFVFQE